MLYLLSQHLGGGGQLLALNVHKETNKLVHCVLYETSLLLTPNVIPVLEVKEKTNVTNFPVFLLVSLLLLC